MSLHEPVNVLLVDDQPGKLLTYETILAELGENLINAASAQEALQVLLKTDIAVVLLDVCMPGMDGYELAELIRKHPRCDNTSIIFVSAVYLSEMDRLRGYGCGAVDYVLVPVVPEVLRAKVGVFADLYRKTRQLSLLNSELERRVAERTAELEASSQSEREARAAAEEANRVKDEFLATLSHELRTPINAVLGWIHLMKRSRGDLATIEEGLEVIERGVRAQVRLIDELLDVNRITTGKFKINPENIDLVAVLDAAVETIIPDAAAKQLAIHQNHGRAAISVCGDTVRLQQVFWNLLSNAVKFTPPGGRIDTWLELDAGHVKVTVSDVGKGIGQSFLPYVFDRFRQADDSTTRGHGGLGLGLTIAKHIVELHRGSITAQSDGDGLGARFVVKLPVNTQVPLIPAEPAARADAVTLAGIQVLVVDDDPATLDVVARTLAQFDARARTAISADEALFEIADHLPDVLVCDIGMPGRDGYSLVRELRSQRYGVDMRCIALTAYTRPQDRDRALAAGFDEHLPKPVDPEQLARLVARLCGRVSAARASVDAIDAAPD